MSAPSWGADAGEVARPAISNTCNHPPEAGTYPELGPPSTCHLHSKERPNLQFTVTTVLPRAT